MNPYIESFSNQIVSDYLENEIEDENELISKVLKELNIIKSESDKLGLLTKILESNEGEYQRHLLRCDNIKTCEINKKHQRVAYYLHQELSEIGFEIPNDSFTSKEKDDLNEKFNSLLDALIENEKLVQDQILQLKQEIEELKSLYIIGKKNWSQLLLGKTNEMIVAGIISEAISKPILEIGSEFYSKIIRPLL